LGLFPGQGSEIVGATLGGDVRIWNKEAEASVSLYKRHTGQIYGLMPYNDHHILYLSGNSVFIWDTKADLTEVKEIDGVHSQRIDILTKNSHSFYTSSLDEAIARYENEEMACKVTLPHKAMAVSAQEDHLWVLTSGNSVLKLDAKTLATLSQFAINYEATAMVSTVTEVWVGDKKGSVHVHSDAGAEIEVLSKHSKAVTCMAVTDDGSKVASGDAYRYIMVWDGASKADVASIGRHKDKINNLAFSATGEELLSTTFDLAFGVTDLASQEMKETKAAHGKKNVTHIC
jgi:WD40 repeat protein